MLDYCIYAYSLNDAEVSLYRGWLSPSLCSAINRNGRVGPAQDAGCFQEEVGRIFAEQGSRTYGLNLFGSDFYQTFEPKNIQALLATQFSDFALGDLRRQAFYPLLGNGIFTTDGKAWLVTPFTSSDRKRAISERPLIDKLSSILSQYVYFV